MSYPSSDASTQLNNLLTAADNYSSSTTPNINFNSTSGIYNPSANVIKIFTNNTDALTIDASQQLSGNGTGLTNLNYNAISNTPTNFQTDWNTTVSNRPTIFSGAYNDLSGKPSLFSGAYNDLSGKPSLFSGVYTDLSSKPDLTVYVTTTNANALNSRFFNNNGNVHGTLTDFNNISQFGYNFILGTTNGPGVNGAGNYYSWDIGLGSEYGFNYSAQFALPRDRSNPYLCVRYKNNNIYGGWNKLSCAFADSAGSVAYANVTDTPDLTNKQDIFTVQRQYPSRAFDSGTSETTTTFLGKTVYTASFTLNNNGSTYDYGTYTCYYNSNYGNPLNTYNVINNNTTDRGVWAGNYNGSNGFYSGPSTNYIVSDYIGDWFIIKFPRAIIMTKIVFYISPSLAARSPGLWKIYGSNDGITWDYLSNASNITTRVTEANYSTGSYTQNIINSGISYLYYGLVVNQLAGNNYYLDFAEWQILGVEKISCQADWNTTIINKPDLTGYATITNLNAKENTLTFTAPLTRTSNTISLDLSSYDTIALRNTALSSYLTSATASSTYATITNLNNKENVLTFSAPLTRTSNTISLDLSSYDTIALRNTALSSYLTSATASSTYATITNLNAKENALTFSAPLTRTTNTISLDLSSYDTIALRNIALGSYLTSATASATYATITNLNTKENSLTFSSPLTRTSNTISLDLSGYATTSALTSYLTSATASTTYATITNLNTKENALTFSAPLTRTTNTISLDLSSYLTSATASTTYATITNLNTKENALTFSAPLTRTSNTISLDTSTYITTTNANALNNRFFNNNGNLHGGTLTNFNSVSQFGYNYIAGSTNGPSIPSAVNQFYAWDIGIGSEYGFGSANGTYRAQFAIPRNTANPYLAIRYQENNNFGSWYKINAGYADSASTATTADVLSAGTKLIQGGLNLTATNAAVYFQGGTTALGYASTAGAYSGSANAGDLVLRSDTNQALILQSGAGGFAIAVNTNNTVSFSGQILLPGSWRFIIGTYGGSGNSLGLANINNNSVWYYRGTQTNISQDISDIRTKQNIENIDNSLELINKLEPKKYIKLVDRDKVKEFGLIAQDVENIIPEVVYNEPYYIADIYEDCVFDNETKIFISTKDQSSILKVGTKIKIVLDKVEGHIDISNMKSKWCCVETEIVEVIDRFTFKIKDDVDINETEVFIYGTLKQDFKSLDYKSLHAISIQATKELYKLIQDLQVTQCGLQNRISILENK